MVWGNRNFHAVRQRRPARGVTSGATPGRHGGHERLLLLLLVPSVPRGPRRRAAAPSPNEGHELVSRQGPALRQPSRVRPGQQPAGHRGRPRARRGPGRAGRGCCSSRTPSRTAMDDTSGPVTARATSTGVSTWRSRAAMTDEVNATLERDLDGELVFCSRSGPPSQPWLEPDVNDRLEELATEGVTEVVVAPIGFVSDHMEVGLRPRHRGGATAERLGLRMVRVPTVGTDAEFVARAGRPRARARGRGPGRGADPGRGPAGRPAPVPARLLPEPPRGHTGAVRVRPTMDRVTAHARRARGAREAGH